MLKRRRMLVYFSTSALLAAMYGLRVRGGTQSQSSGLLWSNKFESSNWRDNWHIRQRGSWGMGSTAQVIADPSRKFSKVLRVCYPAGSTSPAGVSDYGNPSGGAQFYADLGLPPRDSMYLRYYVKFSNNFEFVKGGKLPGLFGGTNVSGGRVPDGTNGFSTRLMWRQGGKGEVYAYLPTSTHFGTSIGRGRWRFQPGKWHLLEQLVVLNKPKEKDGVVKCWFDGELVLNVTQLSFRTTSSLKIEGIFFSTFFGGADRTWAPSRMVYADFSNFAVGTNVTHH